MSTAKAVGINPQQVYIRDVLLRIVRETDVRMLAPHGWQEHFAAEVEAERQAAMARLVGA